MTPEQFVYWMQGFAELNVAPPTPQQWKAIRDHLALVFDKKTPPYTPQGPLDAVPYIPQRAVTKDDWWRHVPTSADVPPKPYRAECATLTC